MSPGWRFSGMARPGSAFNEVLIMSKAKKRVSHRAVPDTRDTRQQAGDDLLLKRGPVDISPEPGTDQTVSWSDYPTRDALLADLSPLPPSASLLDEVPAADSTAHRKSGIGAGRRGTTVETGHLGRSRVNRSGHKP
jgi:hypothetical protein